MDVTRPCVRARCHIQVHAYLQIYAYIVQNIICDLLFYVDVHMQHMHPLGSPLVLFCVVDGLTSVFKTWLEVAKGHVVTTNTKLIGWAQGKQKAPRFW